MSNKNEYIELTYTKNDYEIIIFSEEKTIKLGPKDAKIMFNILKNNKGYLIDDNVYRFDNPMPILIKFHHERKKANKPKKVNRNKSRTIVTGTISLIAILTVSGLLYLNHQNINNPSIVPKEITKEELKTNKTASSNIDVIFTNNTENEDEIEDNNLENDNEAKNFHYYFEISDIEKTNSFLEMENAKKYNELFEKYGNRYGVDPRLLCAMAAHESSGKQSSSNCGKSFGLMAIEKSEWENQTFKVYNFETQKEETITVDYDKVIKDADYNVMIGSAIMQWHFNAPYESGLIDETELLAYSLQRYNMGDGTMKAMVANKIDWKEGRKDKKGDPLYFENVLSKLDNGEVLEMRLREDGTYRYYSITNDALELEPVHIRI